MINQKEEITKWLEDTKRAEPVLEAFEMGVLRPIRYDDAENSGIRANLIKYSKTRGKRVMYRAYECEIDIGKVTSRFADIYIVGCELEEYRNRPMRISRFNGQILILNKEN